MLPEWKHLRKLSSKITIPDQNYFDLADEYVSLKAAFHCETIIDTLNLWIDMLLYPVYIIIQICMQDYSIMSAMTIVKAYQLWADWFRLQELTFEIEHWKMVVGFLGGPWIASNDPDLHVFVYADGMQRIKYSQEHHPSQKTEKTCQVIQHPVQSQVSSPLKSP